MAQTKDNVKGKRPYTGTSTAKDGTKAGKEVKGTNSPGKDNARSTQRGAPG